MKKLNLILIFGLFLVAFQANAQLSFGVKGGYTNAWANYGDVVLPEDAQIDIKGFNVSLLGYWKVNNWLQLGTEPGFVRRGAACFPGSLGWGTIPLFEADTKVYLNYAELPLMTNFHLDLGQTNCTVFAKAGYGVSFLASAFTEVISNTSGTTTHNDLNLTEAPLNRLDHGIYSGLGFGYHFNQHQIFITANYYTGFMDSEQFNFTKNRSLDLSLGYAFSL